MSKDKKPAEERIPWSKSGLIQGVLKTDDSSEGLHLLSELVLVFGEEVGISEEPKETGQGFNYRTHKERYGVRKGGYIAPRWAYNVFRTYIKEISLPSKRTSTTVARLEREARVQ